MYKIKVFLVEDEFVIREGIRQNIEWDANGLELVGDAADGEMAWKQIQTKKPDIVITDIRMPFMDGLELSKLIKQELPETEVVVLSGHEEFEYAKECIRIGVSEYLLKPISREALLEKIDVIAKKIREKKEEKNINKGATNQIEKDQILDFMRLGKPSEVEEFVDKIVAMVGDGMKSQIFRQYVVMDVFFTIVSYFDSIGASQEIQDQLAIDLSELTKYETTIHCLQQLLYQACDLRATVKNSRSSEIVDKIMRYVEENYKDEKLSLNQISEHLCFSANHLSSVFHQEYGQSFVKYLTNYRINKAKKLLRETGMRSSDICYEVGYKDPHYFSHIFKKTLGITPTQYREGKV